MPGAPPPIKAPRGVHTIGVDVGATKTLAALVDPDGAVLAAKQRPTRRTLVGVIATVEAVVDDLLATNIADVSSVGVGIPGLVNPSTGTVRHAVNLDIQREVHLAGTLTARLMRPVHVANDVNAAAVGTAAVTGCQDLALLSLGSGVAAGLVLDGRPRYGHQGLAGELGHLARPEATEPCGCGQRGCYETLTAGSALARLWASSTNKAAQSAFTAAAAGEPRARVVVSRFAHYVAELVHTLILAVDVERVFLGGGVSHDVGDPLLLAVREVLERGESSSSLLAASGMSTRLHLLPSDQPVAAIGAAINSAHDRDAVRDASS